LKESNMKSRKALLALLLPGLLISCSESAPTVKLKPCTTAGTAAQCGSMTVYENRSTQSGRKIKLNLVVIPAISSQRVENAVFVLAGGPGEAATQVTGNIQFLRPILGDRDLVLVDQRGTGGSHEVYPPAPPDWSGLSPSELEKAYATWIKQVLPKLDADPRYYTTSVAMDDLDDVRLALGYEKIDLIGFSYGTTAAQYYLRQHEPHVRSVTLFSGSVGNLPVWERQAANAQRALDALFTRCESDPACSKAFPNVRSEFAALQERLNSQPVIVKLPEGKFTLTSELFAAKVEDLTRDAVSAARLPRLIHKAYAENDWQAWGQASYGDWGTNIMSYSIQCNEKWASFSPEETARWGQGSYLLTWNTYRANKYALLCKYLPPGVTPEGDGDQPVSQVPVLLFNGEFDPLDPPGNVAEANKIWPNSLALTLPWQGHSLSDPTAIYCMQKIIGQFLVGGSAQNISTDCLQDIDPPRFSTSP
jgi:pimeloyl-ACP methyl ester carboxylesterase